MDKTLNMIYKYNIPNKRPLNYGLIYGVIKVDIYSKKTIK